MNDLSASAQASTLFVGDLSIFCTEDHLTQTFGPYGAFEDVKIIRCDTTNKNLCYGFVRLASQQRAAEAMDALNGVLLCGRPLRIRWAAHKTPGSPGDCAADEKKPTTASVHVTYLSSDTSEVITEHHLQSIFCAYGEVVDIIVKRFEIDETFGWQRGYGFVHFPSSQAGISASLDCVEALRDADVEGLRIKCSISHKLEVLLKERRIPYDASHVEHIPFHPPTPQHAQPAAPPQWTMPYPPWPLAPHVMIGPGAACAADQQRFMAQFCPIPYYNFVPAWAYDPNRMPRYVMPSPSSPCFRPAFPPMPLSPHMYPYAPLPLGAGWTGAQTTSAADASPENSEESMETGAEGAEVQFGGANFRPTPFPQQIADDLTRLPQSSKLSSRQAMAEGFSAALQTVITEYDHGSDRDDLANSAAAHHPSVAMKSFRSTDAATEPRKGRHHASRTH